MTPKDCTWDSREKYELLIGPLRERAKDLGYALGVHGTLKRDIDLIACPWTNAAVDAKHLAEQLRLVAEKVIGFAEPNPREVSEYFLDGCPGGKDHGRLCWTFYLDKKGAEDCKGPYIDLSVMPRIREMHLDLVRERALTHALRADMTRTADALAAERIRAVADIEVERQAKEQALSELRASREDLVAAIEIRERDAGELKCQLKQANLQVHALSQANEGLKEQAAEAGRRYVKAVEETEAALRLNGELEARLMKMRGAFAESSTDRERELDRLNGELRAALEIAYPSMAHAYSGHEDPSAWVDGCGKCRAGRLLNETRAMKPACGCSCHSLHGVTGKCVACAARHEVAEKPVCDTCGGRGRLFEIAEDKMPNAVPCPKCGEKVRCGDLRTGGDLACQLDKDHPGDHRYEDDKIDAQWQRADKAVPEVECNCASHCQIARLQEREACAKIAVHATVEPYSIRIHPDIPFETMNSKAQVAAHATAQGIAAKIRERG